MRGNNLCFKAGKDEDHEEKEDLIDWEREDAIHLAIDQGGAEGSGPPAYSPEQAAQAALRARCETLREELRKLEEEQPVRESRITSLQGQQQARARGSSEQAAGGCRD